MPLPLSPDTKARNEASEPTLERLRTERRFDRAARLFGEPGMQRLARARVLVFGVGGVGSFAAEALARSGVGNLVLVDFDRVCVTNANRQLHAMKGTIGRPKVEVMAERLRLVHPSAEIEAIPRFYEESSSEALLGGGASFVIDAIDNLKAKAHLLATCLARQLPIVSSMGAAARMDPTEIRVADLGQTEVDPFARALRKLLRRNHGLDARPDAPIGIPAVFSREPPIEPSPLSYDGDAGFRCVCPGGNNGMHDCERRSRIEGSAAFVTGAFGLAAAGVVIKRLSAG
ncbi:MAG: tRNA threonylcarbamoyladenosine dehydratase [Myxococcales bacterium]|nr:tRNA threonylcarbamoyladenosine dehydratase [Myxococcales bacterium]